MRFNQVFVSAILFFLLQASAIADWPQYRGNQQRTAFHKQDLAARAWKPAWAKKLPSPNAAWNRPARGSLWQNLTSIEPRVTDDRANVPLIVSDRSGKQHVIVPSSTDDRLVALDPLTGNINWQVETNGPIRFAPSITGGMAYLGADDGYVRAVDLENGKTRWQVLVGPGYRSIVGNGRLVSPHPIRTSVLVSGNYVFAHAGLFPSQGVYCVALHRQTGELAWRRKTNASPQGYLLATGDDRLYVPTGRSVPYAIDAADGKKLYNLPSAGGTFCMLTAGVFFSGPGNTPEVQTFAEKNKAKMLSFKARHVAAGNGKIWTANGSRIACLDLNKVANKQQTTLWQLESKNQNGLIVSGNQEKYFLFVGGKEGIDFVNADTGNIIQRIPVDKELGEVINLAVSKGKNGVPATLIASTDSGAILAWHPAKKVSRETPVHSLPTSQQTGQTGSPSPKAAELSHAISRLRSPHGFALVIGNDIQPTIEHIMDQTSLHVVGLVNTDRTLANLRSLFRSRGTYGKRVSIWSHSRGDQLPMTDGIFNLVVQSPAASAQDKAMLEQACAATGILLDANGKTWEKPPAEGLGSWRHQYANPKNLSDSQDPRVGKAEAFKLKWFGGVGPSRMPDRHLRGPAPLSAGASMIVQADGALIGVDPANGTERWQFNLPQKGMRYVTPFDAGYVCLSENGQELFVAANQHIFKLDPFTGKLVASSEIRNQPKRWGYLSQGDDTIVTTQMKLTAPRVATDRKIQRNFVDQDYRSERPLVCSRDIVALDRALSTRWTRKSKGVIPNGSISVDYRQGTIVFIEGRSKSCLGHPTDRIPVVNILERGFLVCLDLKSGKTTWEKEIPWPEGRDILYTQLTPNGVLVTTSQSIGGKARYYCRMFSSSDGSETWTLEHDHIKGGLFHGEQVHHPMILKRPDGTNVLVMEPYFYNLANGKKIIPFGNDANWAIRRPGHSCGTISGSGNCLFFRAGNPTVLNLNQSQANKFTALAPSRPGCWINIIPAGGRLLIPEASASCVCQYSLQTSMCFQPVSKSELAREIRILPDVLPKFQVDPFKPLHRWELPKGVTGTGRFTDRVGSLDLVSNSKPKVSRNGIELDGKQWLTHQLDNPQTPKLPRTITLEVVTSISDSPQWCGLLGAIQDNGPHERGCLLGIHEGKLFFAVASRETARVTYLKAPTPFDKNRKYHVVGTYDGSLMKLYIDGKQVNQSQEQTGAIFYDPHSWFSVGAYKDNDELYIMKGSIQLAAVYQGNMSAKRIGERFKELVAKTPQD